MIQATTNDFDSYVNSDKITVVDFFAEWCQPCQRLLKILPRLESEFDDRVQFIKVNIDEQKILADRHEVELVPTFYIYKNGKVLNWWVGIKTLLEMKREIEKYWK